MPERILFCADNLFSDLLYPDHVITADQEASGFEVWHLANGRRQASDAWRATTANVDHNAKANCGVLRAANFVAIDRASNWRGFRFLLENSADDFASSPVRAVLDINPIPQVPGGLGAGALGCVTDELAWWKTFTSESAYDWRGTFKAGGAGVIPSISGLFLGTAWLPTEAQLFFPVDDEVYDVQYAETLSTYGWAGRSRPNKPRRGTLNVKPATDLDYDFIRWQVLGLYAAGFPAWICFDRVDGGQRAMLVRCPAGELDWGKKRDWPKRGINIPFVEEQVAF